MIESDSKLRALVAELTKMRNADASNKALVFSQFNSTLAWLQRRIASGGGCFVSYSGLMETA